MSSSSYVDINLSKNVKIDTVSKIEASVIMAGN